MASTEVLNAVSPWMGELAWVDNPRTGKSKKGNEWKSVDFVLEYADPHGNGGKILFSTFGADKVDKILSAQIGSTIKVMWKPSAHEYNGRWYSKFDAYDITIVDSVKEDNRQTELPKNAPLFDEDIPF